MSRFLAAVPLCAAPLLAQIPYDHLIYAHRLPSTTVPAIGILDPDHGTDTPLLPTTGSNAANGSRSVAIDPQAPDVLYATTALSTSIAATIPVLTLTGNMFTRTNLQANLGAPGLPFHVRWAPGHGLLILGRGGQVNRMFLRDMATGTVVSQPSTNLLPNNASDMVFLGGKAFATSEGDGTTVVTGTIVEWDLVANTDRVVGTGYPPLSALGVFGGQLVAGDTNGDLHLVDPVTGAASLFLSTGLGKITSIAVDSQSRLFVLVEGPGAWTVHNAFNLGVTLKTSTSAIDDIEVGPAPAATMLRYGSGCAGSNTQTPSLAFSGRPALGQTYGVTLAGGLASTGAFLVLGSSRVQDPSGALPRDLGALGMPGCTQYVDIVASVLTLTDPGGAAQVSFTLPANPAFAGVRIPQQWLVVDAAANALGATTSSGGEAYVY